MSRNKELEFTGNEFNGTRKRRRAYNASRERKIVDAIEALSTTSSRSLLSMRVFRSASIILLTSLKPNPTPASQDLEYLKQT